jgi:hypothetical protein
VLLVADALVEKSEAFIGRSNPAKLRQGAKAIKSVSLCVRPIKAGRLLAKRQHNPLHSPETKD